MGTSVQLTPLSGVYSESHLCYLLDVDGFRFLLDCGWDDRLNVDALQPLARSVYIFNSELKFLREIYAFSMQV